MKTQTWSVLGIVLISICGCAGSKDTILPPEGDTISSIYAAHMADVGFSDNDDARVLLKRRAIASHEADLSGYVRDAFNELDVHFPRLPNPSLVLYVFPHLSGNERVPVPGYATTFPLYTQVEYALPGERMPVPISARDE